MIIVIAESEQIELDGYEIIGTADSMLEAREMAEGNLEDKKYYMDKGQPTGVTPFRYVFTSLETMKKQVVLASGLVESNAREVRAAALAARLAAARMDVHRAQWLQASSMGPSRKSWMK